MFIAHCTLVQMNYGKVTIVTIKIAKNTVVPIQQFSQPKLTKKTIGTIVATINIACLPSPKPQVVPQGSVPSSKGIPEQAQDAILSMILNKHKVIIILMTQPFDVRAPLCL